jgi:hypothetical protein
VSGVRGLVFEKSVVTNTKECLDLVTKSGEDCSSGLGVVPCVSKGGVVDRLGDGVFDERPRAFWIDLPRR